MQNVVQVNPANSGKEAPSGPGRTMGVEAIGVPPAVFEDRSAFVAAARQGLPGLVVKQAVHVLGHRELFVRLLGTTAGNLNRFYRRKTLGPAHSEAVLDALRVFFHAVSVFSGRKGADEWLSTSLPALGGHSPVEFCDTFEGRALVREALRKIEYGEFP